MLFGGVVNERGLQTKPNLKIKAENKRMSRPRNTEEQNAAAKERNKKRVALLRQTPEYKEWRRAYDRRKYLKDGKSYMDPENVGRMGWRRPKGWAALQAMKITTSALIGPFGTVLKILDTAAKKEMEKGKGKVSKFKDPYALPPPDPQMLIAFIKTSLYESLIKLESDTNAATYKYHPATRRKTKRKKKYTRKSADKTGKTYRGRPPAKKTAGTKGDAGDSGA